MNRLSGRILAVESEGTLSLVDVAVGETQMTALLVDTPKTAPYLRTGSPVSVLFKETEVALGKHFSGLLSLQNRLPAVVSAIRQSRLLAEVVLDHGGQRVVAIIPSRAVAHLALAEGDGVLALIKANEVMLGESVDGV